MRARLTGRYQLQPEQRYRPVGYVAPDALDSGRFASIDMQSDFDGDGSSDMLMVYGEQVGADAQSVVYVLPGNSRAPDRSPKHWLAAVGRQPYTAPRANRRHQLRAPRNSVLRVSSVTA